MDAFARLPAPQRHGLEVALLRAAPGPKAPEQRAVFAGLCSVLSELAADQPVLVAVDDLQWLDRPSQAALEFAIRRSAERTIGFLCSLRTGVDVDLAPGLRRALAEADAERTEIGPLSVGALHTLILQRLGRALVRPTVVRIAAASAGNPFYVLEIAREVIRATGSRPPATRCPRPGDLRLLVAERIARLPNATREQLLIAAALSTPSLALLDRRRWSPRRRGLIEIAGTVGLVLRIRSSPPRSTGRTRGRTPRSTSAAGSGRQRARGTSAASGARRARSRTRDRARARTGPPGGRSRAAPRMRPRSCSSSGRG